MSLSNRQKQIVQAVAHGKANKEIAADLGISPHTVGTHMKVIFNRLGVRCRSEAVASLMRASVIA